jgi:A/G-specific adenine glycosylase
MPDSSTPAVTTSVRGRIRRQLVQWFDRHRRDLPWRRTRDPYPIWVSEIMLQQTQVATVVPYFQRFLQAFPTLTALAAAREEEVLRLWEGLGYYRRARDLHQAAKELVARHAGLFPRDPQVLQLLPGLGRYTVGAILSQAFGQRLPILEANSRRVLCRLVGMRDDPRRGPAERRLWQIAEELLPAQRVGDFNQALMELGALVCTPTAPRCSECPLKNICVARRLHLQEAIPPKPAPPETLTIDEIAVVIRRGTKLLLVQRPREGRWNGLWEFPHGPLPPARDRRAAIVGLLRELTGLEAEIGEPFATIRHTVTRHQITMKGYTAEYRAGRFRSSFYPKGCWVHPRQLTRYPVSTPQRRLMRHFVTQPTDNGQ